MTSKKNEIRVIDDLELKNVSGGVSVGCYWLARGVCSLVAIGLAVAISKNIS